MKTNPRHVGHSSAHPHSPETTGAQLPPGALVVAMIGGMFLAATPLANQFTPYTGEACFSGLLLLLFAAGAAVACLTAPRESRSPAGLPMSLGIVLLAFAALHFWGLMRAPYFGGALPLAGNVFGYVLVAFAGWLTGTFARPLRGVLTRALCAMVVVMACAALFQVFVELPRLRGDLESGVLTIPESLSSSSGMARLYGDEAFVTFGNPNSLAAYLLMGFLLLLGHAWPSLRATVKAIRSRSLGRLRPALLSFFNVIFLLVILLALRWTQSKGGVVALACGVGFFVVQRLNKSWLNRLTFVVVAAAVFILILGTAGALPAKLFPLSLQVRFEYWKTAWAMFAQHPLAGVGLGGFEEWATKFKTPMGWEVKDPHNEYLHLLCELGVLGPLFYGMIWWLLLRQNPVPPGRTTAYINAHVDRRVLIAEIFCIVGGAFALLLAIQAFDIFNSADLINVLHGVADPSKGSGTSAAETLLLPFVFALSAMALRADHDAPRQAAHYLSDSDWHAYRAAAGAILLHQLVDFDFRAQAIMLALLLLGGLFVAERYSERAEAGADVPAKWVCATVLVGALALIPLLVWIPYQASTALSNIEDLEQREEAARLDREHHQNELTPEQFDIAFLEAHTASVDATPYDAEALRKLTLLPASRGQFKNEREILAGFNKAIELRPYSSPLWSLLGGFYFQQGYQAHERRGNYAAMYKLSAEAFHKAAELYPLHPGLRLTEGDALFMGGDIAGACALYKQAFDIDIVINDENVFLTSIFTDPRPGVFVRHAYNSAVVTDLSTLLVTQKAAAEANTLTRFGLLVRRMVGLARIIKESENKGVADEAAKAHALELMRELRFTVEEIRDTPGSLAQRAHAALLYAKCLKKQVPFADESKAELEKKQADAVELARKMQAESVAAGTPGTNPDLFAKLVK